MSDIPTARVLIKAILDAGLLPPRQQSSLRHALSLMDRRRPARRKSPVKSREITPADAANIRAWAHSHPDQSLHEIAAAMNTNPGRVSEAMQGDR